jgi:hypothetical protein
MVTPVQDVNADTATTKPGGRRYPAEMLATKKASTHRMTREAAIAGRFQSCKEWLSQPRVCARREQNRSYASTIPNFNTDPFFSRPARKLATVWLSTDSDQSAPSSRVN